MSGEPLKNPRHEIFAQAVAKGASQAEAYREAYPKAKRWKDATIHPEASKLAANPKVSTRISELQAAMAEKSEVDGARILQEAARLALLDPRQLFDEKGRIKPPSEWPDELAACIASVKTKPEYEWHGEDREYVGDSYEVRFWDKNAALLKLFKNKGLFEQDNKQKRGDELDSLTPAEQIALREYLQYVAAGPRTGGKSAAAPAGSKGRTTH